MPSLLDGNALFRGVYCWFGANQGNAQQCGPKDGLLPDGWEWLAFTISGVLVVAAAGNDFRNRVAFPARHADAIAVSACGTENGLPANAYDRWTLSPDRGNSNAVYFANFSNEGIDGTAVDITAPGAGVISTVPGGRYGPMSGTSMACPAAVGAIARILSQNTQILQMAPDRQRRDAIWHSATGNLTQLGFSVVREGRGMVQ